MYTFSNFQFIPNCPKQGHLKKLVLSIVAYGVFLTCITSIAFTMNTRHTRGLFAMKCITICSDMNIYHFNDRFLYTNDLSLNLYK